MSDTQQIKDKIDIVDFIGEYVQLKAAGTNHKGLCPFHNEQSPSFMVSRERNSWHCFGCNKGGDVFSFLQEIEGMEFVEALKYLAEKAGVEITFKKNDIETSLRNRLRDINVEAARFFHNFLTKMDASQPAREYLHNRGLTDETIEAWQIGFVPDQWELLTKYLLKKNFSIDDLVASGLTIKRDGAAAGRGFYDRFRGRIMFPIKDAHGYVVGFTGRVLVETEKSGGKYVNTPQTPVFDKSRLIFGLYEAKQDIKKQDLAVLVEGQMDVIACHQAGMTHVVASSGTALTEMHVALLKRYTKNISMAFDADEAGQKAAKRGIDIALKEGLNVKVIQIPEGAGKDPDDCIQKNRSVWFDAVAQAQDIMEWYFLKAFAGKDITNPKDKQAAADLLLPEIKRIPYAIEQDHWLRELAGRIAVDVAVLREDMKRLETTSEKKIGAAQTQGQENRQNIAMVPKKETRLHTLVKRLLMLFFVHHDRAIVSAIGEPIWYDLGEPFTPLYESIKLRYTNSDTFDLAVFRESLSEKTKQWVNTLLLLGDEEFSSISDREKKHEISLLVENITREWKKQKRTEILQKIEQAGGDQEKVQALLVELQQLS